MNTTEILAGPGSLDDRVRGAMLLILGHPDIVRDPSVIRTRKLWLTHPRAVRGLDQPAPEPTTTTRGRHRA